MYNKKSLFYILESKRESKMGKSVTDHPYKEQNNFQEIFLFKFQYLKSTMVKFVIFSL